MPIDYKSIEFRLHEYLVQVQEMLILLEGDSELIANITANKELIKSKKYNVAVMGEFKRGKSSLINALLGSKILPADSTPTTATINRITYGINPTVIINYKNGDKKEINISELSEYVTKLTPNGEARAVQIKEATVLSPTVICQNHVDIIDTPGLNDDSQMTKTTIEMIENVDAVILAISAKSPFSETERNFVCQLIKSDSIYNIVFVVTFLDQLDDEEYDYDKFVSFIKKRIYEAVFEQFKRDEADEATLRKAHQILDDIYLFGISSTLALKSFVSNDRALLKKSRFEKFQTELLKIITAKQVENATQKTVFNIKNILSQVDKQHELGIIKLKNEMQYFEHCSANLYKYCEDSKKYLQDIFTKNNDSLNAILNRTNSLKNLVVSEFIKKISTIRINTNKEIATTISTTSLACYNLINEVQGLQIQKELLAYFEDYEKRLLEFRNLAFKDNLLALKLENESLGNSLKSLGDMLEFARSNLEKVKFGWKVSAIPNTPDLTNCNVIENIIMAVDISINKYHEDLKACIDKIREYCFDQLSVETEAIIKFLKEKGLEERERIDTKIKTKISNYVIQSKNAEVIAKNSDLVLKEFYDASNGG